MGVGLVHVDDAGMRTGNTHGMPSSTCGVLHELFPAARGSPVLTPSVPAVTLDVRANPLETLVGSNVERNWPTTFAAVMVPEFLALGTRREPVRRLEKLRRLLLLFLLLCCSLLARLLLLLHNSEPQPIPISSLSFIPLLLLLCLFLWFLLDRDGMSECIIGTGGDRLEERNRTSR